jgi:RNA polymerase sigma-70 factor (ECF subfamily)
MNEVDDEFQEIHDAFRPRILRYLSRLVGDSEAEDLTQEVFTKVHHALPGFRGESKISTWIYRIATNSALDRLRTATSRCAAGILPGETVEEGEVNPWTGESPPSIESQVASRAMSECIREFIFRLPDNYRTVLVLGDLEGLQDREIAEILGVSLQATKIRLHRARERLRRELETGCDLSWHDGDGAPPCSPKLPAKAPPK